MTKESLTYVLMPKGGSFRDPVLSLRAKNFAPITDQYAVTAGGSEVAYVALDKFPGSRELVLYELFVHPMFRKSGIGSSILSWVEDTARQLGYAGVMLRPHSLSEDVPQQVLVAWYSKRGYQLSEEEEDVLIKSF